MKCCPYIDICSFASRHADSRALPVIGAYLAYCKHGRTCKLKKYWEKHHKFPSSRMMPDGSRLPGLKKATCL